MRNRNHARRWIGLLCSVVVGAALAACGGGGGGDGGSAPAAPAPAGGGGGGTPPAPGPTRPLNVTLKQADYLEFFWYSSDVRFRQDTGGTAKVTSGRFKVTLGASVLIQGQAAFPLAVTGSAGEFAPRWTHIAVGSDGSLLGSTDGAGLTKIYDAASGSWVGGGMFIDFGQNPMTVAVGRFKGAYNDVAAIVAGRSSEKARCEQILGLTFCSNTSTKFSEREFYKEGIGPIGFAQHQEYSSDGGGFTTATTIDKTVELIETSLRPTDGSVFVRPPWDEMAPLATPRRQHAAVVLDGKIWVLGGFGKNGQLASVEIYDPATNKWSAGPAMPKAFGVLSAVTIGTRIFVLTTSNEILRYDGTTWTTIQKAPAGYTTIPFADWAYFSDPTFGDIVVGASFALPTTPQIGVLAYQPSGNQWLFGVPQTGVSRYLRLTVETVGNSMFVIGGFGPTPDGLFNNSGALDDVLTYNLLTDTWGAARTLKRARDNHASIALNGKIYVVGGNPVTCDPFDKCSFGVAYREVEVFDPATGKSSDVPPMFQPRKNASAVALNGLIYVIGGTDGTDTLGSMERLTPP